MNEQEIEVVDLALEKSIQRAIGLGEEITDEQKRQILEKRARDLAQPISDTKDRSVDTLRVLTFRMGKESYAIPAASVYTVLQTVPITPVPCVPNFVAGITNLRGHIRSVVHLAKFLGLHVAEEEAEEYILVAQHGDIEVAFLVTGLDEVTDIPRKDIKARPPSSNSTTNHYIDGIVLGGLVLLDLATIFTDERFIINDEVN